MNSKNLAALLAVSLLPTWGAAQQLGGEGSYWGASWVMAEAGEFDLSAVQGRYGWAWRDNFSFEALGAFGVGDDTISGVTAELDYIIGGYVVGEWPVTEQMNVYGRLGFAFAEATVDDLLESSSESDSDVSYGFGATYSLNETMALDVGYMDYVGGDIDVDGLYIGAKFPLQ